MTGVPNPYTINNDSTMLLLLVLGIIGSCYVLSSNGNSIVERIKSMFFYSGQTNPYNNRTEINRFGSIVLYFIVILCSVIITIRCMLYSENYPLDRGSYFVPAILAGLFILFLLVKRAMYDIVNMTLFTKKQADEWRLSYFFTIQLMGFILLPLTVALVLYPSLSDIFAVVYLVFAIILYLIMLVISCINIIFCEKCYFLDIFLYLCAIELQPIVLMWYAIHKTNLFNLIKF